MNLNYCHQRFCSGTGARREPVEPLTENQTLLYLFLHNLPVIRTIASCKSAGEGGTRFPRGHEDRSAEGVGHWYWCPLPQPTKRSGGVSWAPPVGSSDANAFLAYLKPTEQPIKSSIFRKRPLEQGALGFSGGARPPNPSPLGYELARNIANLLATSP